MITESTQELVEKPELRFEVPVGERGLTQADAKLLGSIRRSMPILSDLSRSDLVLYVPAARGALVVDQARPHSIYPIYAEDLIGQTVGAEEAPWVHSAFAANRMQRGQKQATVRDAPIVREVLPVIGQARQTIAALSIETNLLAYERHRRRSAAFRTGLAQLQEMALRGELEGAEELSPFGEHDGIVLVDLDRTILYMSGIATNLFRRIGYMGNLIYRSIYRLETADAELVDLALNRGICLERENEEHGRFWMRKALPVFVPKRWWQPRPRAASELPAPPGAVPRGVLLTIHDATEARDKERELKAKSAMIQEIHHRVKNNLQSIVSLLRLQERRTRSPEVRQSLTETVNRILSVAVVHEFLSYDTGSVINLLEIAQRIASQMSQSIVDPTKGIQFRVTGPSVFLSSQQATTGALVINELLQNALEHGFAQRNVGTITVALADDGEWVRIEIGDDGAGLPSQFNLAANSGLGLRIVQMLVQGDLKGNFELRSGDGVKAVVTFPKTLLGGAKS